MRIEKPEWTDMVQQNMKMESVYNNLNYWFRRKVEPINTLLAEGVPVFGERTVGGFDRWLDSAGPNTDSKALLINIEPIKKETAEDVLRMFCDQLDSDGVRDQDLTHFYKRAKAVLGQR